MPEPPDFDQIARAIAQRHAGRWDEDGEGNRVDLPANEDDLTADIVELLRQVWNARGAADEERLGPLRTAWKYLTRASSRALRQGIWMASATMTPMRRAARSYGRSRRY
jgi:hypothetical protein